MRSALDDLVDLRTLDVVPPIVLFRAPALNMMPQVLGTAKEPLGLVPMRLPHT